MPASVGVILLGELIARRADLIGVRAREHRRRNVVGAIVLQLVEPDIAAAAQYVDEVVVRQILHIEHTLRPVRHRRSPFSS